MPTAFSFERDIHETLELLPMEVRRKLDLVRSKLSLADWQSLPIEQRRALVDAPEGDAFLEALRGATVKPLGPAPDPWPWRTASVPPALLGKLTDVEWASLDDGDRYALLKLAESKHDRDRVAVALAELSPFLARSSRRL